jgi:hypothetical protein
MIWTAAVSPCLCVCVPSFIICDFVRPELRTMCLCCALFINCVVHFYYCPIHLYCNHQLEVWCAHGWEAAEIIQISHNLVSYLAVY